VADFADQAASGGLAQWSSGGGLTTTAVLALALSCRVPDWDWLGLGQVARKDLMHRGAETGNRRPERKPSRFARPL